MSFSLEFFQGLFRLVAVGLRHVAADHADGGVKHGHVIGKAKAQKKVRNDIKGHDEIGKGAEQDAFHLEGRGGIKGAIDRLATTSSAKGTLARDFFSFGQKSLVTVVSLDGRDMVSLRSKRDMGIHGRQFNAYLLANHRPAIMMIMAANCSRTRQRIRFCERLAEPPRIMFHRPRSRTTATAATASGTR